MSTPGQDGESVDSTILLLSHSSKMIQLFNDKLTISSLNDERFPYETNSAAAALQNDFKKRYKRAAKGLAAAVAKNGCFALQSGKPFDSDKQRCCSGAENPRITICAAKWLRILRQRMLFPR